MALTVKDSGRVDGRLSIDPFSGYSIQILDDDTIVQTIDAYPWIYTTIVGIYTILSVITTIIAFAWTDGFSPSFTYGGILLAALMAHIILSITYVKQNELGGLLFYGRPLREVNPGIIFAPYGLVQVVRLPKSPVQEQFPGDPEKIYKGSDETFFALSKDEQAKYVLPIRALTNSKKSTGDEESTLDSQMTLEVNFYVRWQVEHFWIFLVRIGDQQEALRQLRDSGERVSIQEVAKRTPREVITQLSEINEKLADELELITQDWGIRIVETAMLAPDLTHKVNDALRNVVVKKAEATQTRITADAQEYQLTKEGKGKAAAKQAELEALAAGAKALGLSGQEIIDLEKARAFASGKATVFIDGSQNTGSLFGIGAKLAAGAQVVLPALRNTSQTEEKE